MPYIYLVHCRASINANENVYKIGKSLDFNKRLSGYDKGTILIFTIYVNECDEIEKTLIQIFESKFMQRKDYGNEYFYGNINDMIDIIMTEYKKCNLCYSITTNKDKDISVNINNMQFEMYKKLEEKKTQEFIKSKQLITNKLNKITIDKINNFIDNITINSQDYNHSTYYHSLKNYANIFIQDTQNNTNKLKYGKYLENKNNLIYCICYAAYCSDDHLALKLLERIKISI